MGNGDEVLDGEWEWDGSGNDSIGMGGNGNNNCHSRTPLQARLETWLSRLNTNQSMSTFKIVQRNCILEFL